MATTSKPLLERYFDGKSKRLLSNIGGAIGFSVGYIAAGKQTDSFGWKLAAGISGSLLGGLAGWLIDRKLNSSE